MKGRRCYIAVTGILTLAAATVAAGERVIVEAILVRVNDRILTVNEFRNRLQVELAQYAAPESPEALGRFARQVFEAVVDEMVLLERAEEKRIPVREEAVEEAIKQLREDNNLLGDEEFQAALAGAGLTEERLRERYRRSMLVQRAAQSEIQATEITEEELRQRYQSSLDDYRIPPRVSLEQVFFPVASDGSDRPAVLQRARGLVERVRAGSDLKAEATLAGIEVQDLGAIPEGDLRPELQDVLGRLRPGEFTDPIDTGGGVQVIRLIERLPSSYQPFEEVREAIRRQMSMEAYQEQTRGVVERLKGEYLVEVDEERLAGIMSEIGAAAS